MTSKSTLTTLTLAAALAASIATMVPAQDRPQRPFGGPMMGLPAFSAIDTNNDGVASPAEIKAYEAAQIKGLDANGDGFLTADEIAAQMTRVATERMTASVTAKFAQIDPKGDGKITIAEAEAQPMPMSRLLDRMLKMGDGKITKETFDAMQARIAAGAGRMRGEHRGIGMRGSDRAQGMLGDHGPMARRGAMGIGGPLAKLNFADIDANKDGVITADEVKAYQDARITAMDANKDGFISVDEFVSGRLANLAPAMQDRATKMVAALDLNGDSKISIEELAVAPMSMMFAHFPANADGSITKAEYAQAQERMQMMYHGRRGEWRGEMSGRMQQQGGRGHGGWWKKHHQMQDDMNGQDAPADGATGN
jgi:Ca2+-binding EF-hand superfamily protein